MHININIYSVQQTTPEIPLFSQKHPNQVSNQIFASNLNNDEDIFTQFLTG